MSAGDQGGGPPSDPRKDAFRSLFYSHEETPPPAPPPGGERGFAAEPVKAAPPPRPFRFFAADDHKEAQDLADEFDGLLGPDGGDAGLGRVMTRFHEAAAKNTQLAQWALRFFIGRHPDLKLPLPTLREQLTDREQTDPQSFARMRALGAKPHVRATGGTALLVAPAVDESAIDYFRHDIDLSDHHVHWHTLYPWGQRRAGISGRLFVYMHEQMLARYDTERFTAGLAFVEPLIPQWDNPANAPIFDDTAIPTDALAPWIPTAFPPNTYVGFDLHGNSPNQLAPDFVQHVVDDLTAMARQISSGGYTSDDDVGADLEASSGRWPGDPGPHNSAHCTVSFPLGDGQGTVPNENGNVNTVMIDPTVAMTTPIFYRVHRAVDNYSYQWQLQQGPDPWNYVTPNVTIRRSIGGANGLDSPDLIITPRTGIPGIDNFTAAQLQSWAATSFGGANFDTAITDPALNAPQLATQLIPDPTTGAPHLRLADDWVYAVRLNNTSADATVVTARLWLAAEELANDRRYWIEMDKFTIAVPGNQQLVFARPSWYSVVVRAKGTPFSMQSASQDDQFAPSNSLACECGLPYRLLLPKGKPEGMQFRFMLLLTDAAEDGLAPDPSFDETCGSVSFCGNSDFAWPDNKAMGFPFDRPFGQPATDNPLPSLDAKQNVVWRQVTIQNTVTE